MSPPPHFFVLHFIFYPSAILILLVFLFSWVVRLSGPLLASFVAGRKESLFSRRTVVSIARAWKTNCMEP